MGRRAEQRSPSDQVESAHGVVARWQTEGRVARAQEAHDARRDPAPGTQALPRAGLRGDHCSPDRRGAGGFREHLLPLLSDKGGCRPLGRARPAHLRGFQHPAGRVGPDPGLAIRDVLTRASAAEREQLRERVELLLSVALRRATLVDQIRGPMRLLAEAMAERSGRLPDDPAVRAAAGAVMGVGLAAMFAAAEDPGSDLVSMLDEGLAQLAAGLPL